MFIMYIEIISVWLPFLFLNVYNLRHFIYLLILNLRLEFSLFNKVIHNLLMSNLSLFIFIFKYELIEFQKCYRCNLIITMIYYILLYNNDSLVFKYWAIKNCRFILSTLSTYIKLEFISLKEWLRLIVLPM